ncbi:MAG TPA: hypothetical protein VFC74_09195 [Oscillospiraceae bacterium]|nr:hypothetical protein [Oscillospiraceae bacterium]
MRERIKSVILFVLIITSVFLTTKLLFGRPYWETASPPAYEQVTFGDLRPLQEQILPVLRLGEDVDWLQLQPWDEGYQEAWEWLNWLFRPRQAPTTTSLPDFTGLQVRLDFSLPVEPNWWVTNRQLNGLEIRQAVWFAEAPQAVWYQAANGKWLRGELTLPEQWESQLNELFAVGLKLRAAAAEELAIQPAAGSVLLPQEVPRLAVHTITAENLETEKLLGSFFVNLALVRRIEEGDGAVIYTDGQKGLRIFSHGELEFNAPENIPGANPQSLVDTLQQGAQYLQLMGGWPDHLYLQKAQLTAQSIKWEQRYTQELIFQSVQKGVPLLGTNPTLRLYFSDRGVIYYHRQIYLLGSPVGTPSPLVKPHQAVAAVAAALGTAVEEQRLVAVSPVLYFGSKATRQSLARPVWQVQLQDEQTAVVDGFTGEFITWLE